jgi:hypothetical protein
MRNLTPLVTALMLDRPMCLECIATKSGVPAARLTTVIRRIGAVLAIDRHVGRCRACGRMDAEVVAAQRPRS